MYDLSQISADACVRAPRIVLLGVEKIGKSTFAAGADSPIFLPIKGEEGIDDIPVAKTKVCTSFKDVLGWLYELGRQENEYETVVIDSASALEPIIYSEVCREADVGAINEGSLGFGSGLEKVSNKWREITETLDALRTAKNLASILIGHVKIRRFDDPEGDSYDQYQWDIHERTANLLYRWADCILFCNNKVVVKEEKLGFHKDNVKKRGIDAGRGRRFLYTQKNPAHPGGGRGVYGRIPYELPLDWSHFRDAVATAMGATA